MPEVVVVRTVAVRMDAVRMDAVRMPEGVEAVPDSSQVEGHIPEVRILETVEAGHTEHMAGSSLQREIEIPIKAQLWFILEKVHSFFSFFFVFPHEVTQHTLSPRAMKLYCFSLSNSLVNSSMPLSDRYPSK